MDKIHVHKINWHTFGVHLVHLVHDSRFWACVALAVLLGVIVLMTIMTTSGNINSRPVFPAYPYGIPFH